MALDQRPAQNPLSHNCSNPKTVMEQTNICTQSSSDDDLSLSPTLIARQTKKTCKSVDNPLLHIISTIGDDDSDEGDILPYPDSQALIERFWDLKLSQHKENDDIVEYVGSNSIDSGYKSNCETPEVQYHSLDHQPNQRLAKRGSVSSLSSTGSSGSISSGVSSIQTTLSSKNLLKNQMNSVERINRRPPLPPSRRITKVEKTEDIKNNEEACNARLQPMKAEKTEDVQNNEEACNARLHSKPSIQNNEEACNARLHSKPSTENTPEISNQDLENNFQYNAKSRTYTTSYASKCIISPLSSERRPRSSSPVSRSSSIKRKRHHSGDLTENEHTELFDSEKVEEYLLPDHCLFTNWLQHTTSGLDPPPHPKHKTPSKIKTTTKSEVKQQALNILEQEIDSMLYGFHPSKAVINVPNIVHQVSKEPSLIPPPRPPKNVPPEPPEEETAIYSPAVTQCVLDVLRGIHARNNNCNTKESSSKAENGDSEIKRTQGPSSFLKEYIQSQMLKQQSVEATDSDCTLNESHLYEEIVYGTANTNTKPPSPPPPPPPLPARPAHIFKKYISMRTQWTAPFFSSQSQRNSINSQNVKAHLSQKQSSIQKSSITTKQTENISQTSQICSQNHQTPRINVKNSQHSKNNNTLISNDTQKNTTTVAQLSLPNNRSQVIDRSQPIEKSQTSKQLPSLNKPTPPPKPVKPPRTSIINSPQLPVSKSLQNYRPISHALTDSNQSSLLNVNPEQGQKKGEVMPSTKNSTYKLTPPENNNENKTNKPNQRSNLYSIFKDRDHRRCLSASLHQEYNDLDQEHKKDIFTDDVKHNTNIIEQLKSTVHYPVVSSDDDYGFKIVPHIV